MEDTTIEDVLKTVETLHNQKDYAGALKTLEANQAKISPGLWHYNMGTEYGKLQNYPLSRFHFMMADLEGFSTKELFQNKELVENKLEVQKLEKPLTVSDYLRKGSLIGSQGIFTLVSLVLIIAGIVSVWKKAGFKVFVSLLLCAGILLGLNFWVNSWNKSIVVTAQTIYDGPSVIFSTTNELAPGVMLITSKEGEWLKVVYPSRFSGWIKNTGLKELK